MKFSTIKIMPISLFLLEITLNFVLLIFYNYLL